MRIPISIINTHIKISKIDFHRLFWKESFLNQISELPQTWAFFSDKQISIKTDYWIISEIPIIWPLTSKTQILITKSDLQKIFPESNSKKIISSKDLADVNIIWPENTRLLKNSIQIIDNQILVSVPDAKDFNLRKNKKLSVIIKDNILDNVTIKVKDNYIFDLQIDYDTAKKLNIQKWDRAKLLVC